MFRHDHNTYYVGTARFNPQTKIENESYCKRNNITGCVYGFPIPITDNIPIHANVFIIEMLNVDKKHVATPGYVTGIGLISNTMRWREDGAIYTNREYNRHIYEGNYVLKRENMNAEQLKIMKRLDWILFHGSSHMKRSTWVTQISNDMLEYVPLKPLLVHMIETIMT
jgi:hypothetical protein